MTKYRESELHSSSLYNQNDPWDPPVVFEEFLGNNENIENEVQPRPPPAPAPDPIWAQSPAPCPLAACCVDHQPEGHRICSFLKNGA